MHTLLNTPSKSATTLAVGGTTESQVCGDEIDEESVV